MDIELLNQVKLANGRMVSIEDDYTLKDELEKVFDWDSVSKIYNLMSLDDDKLERIINKNLDRFDDEESKKDILDALSDISVDAEQNVDPEDAVARVENIIEDLENPKLTNKESILDQLYELKQELEQSRKVNLEDVKYVIHGIKNSVYIQKS